VRQIKKHTISLVKSHKNQLKLYIFFGLIAFFADFSTLKLSLVIGLPLLLATSLGIAVGFIVSYIANNFRISTTTKTKKKKESLPLFIALFLWNIIFTYIFINVFKNHFTTPLIIPKALSVGIIMVWNYVLFHFIFTDKAHNNIDEII